MTKLKKEDLVLITIGLIGAVVLWIDVDPGGWVLYLSFFSFGVLRIIDYFKLGPYQRDKTQIIKLILSSLMIITVITHVIWGGRPLFGLLATLLLVYLITNLQEREEKNISESEV
jgi:cytochrome c oxidase subunit IV